MIPDHESSLGPERYDPDWFLAQLSGREPDTARSAVERVTEPATPATIATPILKASSAPGAAVPVETPVTRPIEILRPAVPAVRRGALVAAAVAALLLITGAALAANRGVESVALAAGAPDKLPASVSESDLEGYQLPTLVLPEDSTPDAPTVPSPSPGAPSPAPAGTPKPEPTTTPDPEPTTPSEPSPEPATPAEPNPEPTQPADPGTTDPDSGLTGIPLVDDLCVLLGLCS